MKYNVTIVNMDLMNLRKGIKWQVMVDVLYFFQREHLPVWWDRDYISFFTDMKVMIKVTSC